MRASASSEITAASSSLRPSKRVACAGKLPASSPTADGSIGPIATASTAS